MPPRSTDNSAAAASLLSLSMAGKSAAPVAIKQEAQPTALSSSAASDSHKQQRRLASTGRHRRRLSDAREASQRPSPASLQPSSVGSLPLNSLSLSSSPGNLSTSVGSASSAMGERKKGSTPIPIANGKNGKKRGHDYKCETCAKIYRHPSCLIKHRWEHTSHWREASKFVLSKHQQVQLLEAAAILSHLSPESATGTSLPEDRSLWPAYLSNGTLPPPEGMTLPIPVAPKSQRSVSSSVPPSAHNGRATSAGPRMHDYSIPLSTSEGGVITQLRPGLIGVPTGSSPVPVPRGYREHTPSDSWASSSPYQHLHPVGSSYQSSNSYVPAGEGEGAAGWSLPRSSMRSDSGRSRSRSDEEDDDSVVDIEIDVPDQDAPRFDARRRVWKREDEDVYAGGLKEEDEYEQEEDDAMAIKRSAAAVDDEWDGMEMDMEMD